MKKLLLTLTFIGLTIGMRSQSTATDFTANDCLGNSYTLFSELNSGKVVILVWVMPCGNCTATCQYAQSVADSYSISNPGQVVFYIADDIGTTSCATLNNWASTNSITATAKFTNSVINMSDYGASGMPKAVVMGGPTTHSVYYNQNGGNNTLSGIQNAVSQAVQDATGLQETSSDNFGIKLSPSPASDMLQITTTLKNASELTVEVYTIAGQKCKSQKIQTSSGKTISKLDVADLQSGTYFCKIGDGKNAETVKFLIFK
jgi:hypothetical protein